MSVSVINTENNCLLYLRASFILVWSWHWELNSPLLSLSSYFLVETLEITCHPVSQENLKIPPLSSVTTNKIPHKDASKAREVAASSDT